MVTLNKIYTKQGDDGKTNLGSTQRVSKDHDRINAYGTVDELNASVGIIVVLMENYQQPEIKKIAQLLTNIQNDLFDIGADLAVPQLQEQKQDKNLRIQDSQVKKIEKNIDQYNKNLKPLKSFIIPGGGQLAAHLHMARTICRRAERCLVKLKNQPQEYISKTLLQYLNRLSDLLFVLSRYTNLVDQKQEPLWIPANNR